MSICYTEKHKVVGINRKDIWEEDTIDNIFNNKKRIKVIRSGVENKKNLISLSLNELKLYICLVADGSIVNSSLGRFRVKKEYKLKYFKLILEELGISYTENKQKDSSICINFTIPYNILSLKIKGLS